MTNSVIITVITVMVGGVVNSMAGFALARIRFQVSGLVLGLIVAALIVPFETLALRLSGGPTSNRYSGPTG